MLERHREALLLLTQHLGDAYRVLCQFRVGGAHLLHQVVDELVEERLVLAELVAVAQGAPHDPAQHVAAPLIGRNHTVDDEEGARPDVIGDHLQGVVGQIGGVGDPGRRGQQALKQVDLVVAVHLLQARGEPLEAHAGIDARLGQGVEHRLSRGGIDLPVELHENVVPDLDIAVAIRIGTAGGTAPYLGAVVVEDLRARPARPGVGHLPEIVRCEGLPLVVPDAHHAFGRQADDLGPDPVGFVVGLVDGGPELGRVKAVHLREQFPGPDEGIMFEIVAKGPVAKHLEKRMVARGVADIFQVVVLAAGAQAALYGDGADIAALLGSEEHVLELHHPGVGEQ